MAKIIKVMQGTASFTKEQEFSDEATAQIGEKPTEEKFIVTNMYDLKIFIWFMSVKTDSCIYTKFEILSRIHLPKSSTF